MYACTCNSCFSADVSADGTISEHEHQHGQTPRDPNRLHLHSSGAPIAGAALRCRHCGTYIADTADYVPPAYLHVRPQGQPTVTRVAELGPEGDVLTFVNPAGIVHEVATFKKAAVSVA